MSTTVTKPRGRHFFANPGPTNIPDSVLRALDRPSIDFHDPDFVEVYDAAFAGVKRVLQTQHHLFMYNASGHGAWEASLTNLLSPGDAILVLESGYFSEEWANMARAHGLDVHLAACDWRHGVDIAQVKTALAEDTGHAIKAVCVVHNETATGMMLPLDEIRAAIDAAKHPALFLVDTISSLGSLDFRMDEWKIDCVVGGSQKGLMLPTGLSFTGVSPKGDGGACTGQVAAVLFRLDTDGEAPAEELHRHDPGEHVLRAARVDPAAGGRRPAECLRPPHATGGGDAPRRAGVGRQQWAATLLHQPGRYSDSVTAILMPEGHDAEALRHTARHRFNVSLGGGLGRLGGRMFRIGHLGDLNEPMLLGALSAVEMACA